MKRWIWIGAGALLLAVIAAACKATRAGYEEPAHRVVRTEGKFELRDYEAFSVVSTPMKSAGGDMNGGFMRLFRYISGDNERAQKVAMTIPVFVNPDANAGAMSFVVPQKVAAVGAPKPTGAEVSLEQVEAGRFAVLRFRGSREGANPQAAGVKIAEWVAAQKLRPVGAPRFAFYDPPWTPSFLRRNEVLLRVVAE